MSRRIVWKAGGSILVDHGSFEPLADRVSDYIEDDSLERIYVVVSAMLGVTDRLLARIACDQRTAGLLQEALEQDPPFNATAAGLDNPSTAEALLAGELESASRLCNALATRGLEARCVTQFDNYPIVAEGSYLRGRLDLAASRSRFGSFDKECDGARVVVLPGFAGVNRSGEPVLLGRNASDFVAAIVSALDRKVEEVFFLKDVGGLYEHFGSARERLIPAITAADLRRLESGGLLDRRTLDVIACDFRIIDMHLKTGTTVVLGSLPVKKGVRSQGRQR
jgi:aspartokinase